MGCVGDHGSEAVGGEDFDEAEAFEVGARIANMLRLVRAARL